MTNIVSVREAINHAKVISSCEHLSDYCIARLFMIFKDRYNSNVRYYTYYTPFDNYEDDDILMNKIFNNVKDEEFVTIGIYDGNEENTFYYDKNEIPYGLDPNQPYNITDVLVDPSVYNYYKNKGIKVFGVYDNNSRIVSNFLAFKCDKGCYCIGSTPGGTTPSDYAEIIALIDKKQDVLIPGDGISIDENNVISCTCEITLINGGDSNE